MVDSAGNALVSTAATGISDSVGRYRISGLANGTFLIGFQHVELSALGLEASVRKFGIAADTTVAIDLAIPSGASVRGRRCPGSSADEGMVAGFVLDAAEGVPVSGVSVTVGWSEAGTINSQLRALPRSVTALGAGDGTYVVCRVPSGGTLTINTSQPGYRVIVGEIALRHVGVARRDFRLVRTSASRSGGVFRGRVQQPDGSSVASGRASIPALDAEAAIENGSFSMSAVPIGTWALELRAIGYEPQTTLIDVTESAAPLLVTLLPRGQLLDGIAVVARRNRNARVLDEIAERGRLSRGTQFFAGGPFMATATVPSDVVRLARGFRSLGNTAMARGCEESGLKGKHMVVFVDDALVPEGLSAVPRVVAMKDIMAIETYPDAASVPVKWRRGDVCAAVAIWTRQ